MTRKFSVIYKILTTLSLLLGITLNLFKTTSITALLSYYTLQSNIMCFLLFAYYTVINIRNVNGNYKKGNIYYFIKGCLIITIFLTCMCYHLNLSKLGFNMEPLQLEFISKKVGNFLVHTLSPILVILDYFLFDEKGFFKKYYPFLWLIFPLTYVLYVYIYSSHGGTFYGIGGSERFAYFFLDYAEIGVMGVFKWILSISIGILVFSYGLILVDKMLSKRKKS